MNDQSRPTIYRRTVVLFADAYAHPEVIAHTEGSIRATLEAEHPEAARDGVPIHHYHAPAESYPNLDGSVFEIPERWYIIGEVIEKEQP